MCSTYEHVGFHAAERNDFGSPHHHHYRPPRNKQINGGVPPRAVVGYTQIKAIGLDGVLSFVHVAFVGSGIFFFVSKIKFCFEFFFFGFLPSTTSHIRSMVNNGFLKSLTSLNTSTYGAGAPAFGNSIDLRDPISSDAIKPCETDGATECVHGKSNGHG